MSGESFLAHLSFVYHCMLTRAVQAITGASAWSFDIRNLTISWKVTFMAINKSLASSSLADVVDRILDKGVVVDAFVRVALVGIELISIEARVVIASVETYLRYAEAVGLTMDPVAVTA